jgi:catalase-peroxidase
VCAIQAAICDMMQHNIEDFSALSLSAKHVTAKDEELMVLAHHLPTYRSPTHQLHCFCTSPIHSDGRGGTDGGTQRFEPELSWEDNANLIKAHKLLEPIKHKYGVGLSWGDLIAYAGTVAIEDMGGPVLGFAAGRIDHIDNSQMISIGPSPEQEKFQHVEVNGDAEWPLGQDTMELIYVNPEGKMGEPDPQKSADNIRDVFGRMGMDDRENVALIGGGHTFGKAHGAGPDGPGPAPKDQPENPFPGTYGTGKGNDAVGSGLEGPWTDNPTQWDNNYFKFLLKYEWEKYKGPGGRWQWRVKGGNGPQAPKAAGEGKQDIMMFTTDVALVTDPTYRKYVEEFANDLDAFSEAFAKVWYKLVCRDLGPYSRLVGPELPPPQDFQYLLPDPPSQLADMAAVEADLSQMIMEEKLSVMGLVRLARNSANTFRHTDYQGGPNGARIRFSPGKDWKINDGLDKMLADLEPIKQKYGEGLTWADLIVLAGNVAVKSLGAPVDLPFCPGRSDALDGKGWENLGYTNNRLPETIEDVVDRNELRGLTNKEFVALCFPDYPSTQALKDMLEGSANTDTKNLEVLTLRHHPDIKQHVDYYISAGDERYKNDFAYAWTKLMNIDRFDGPVHNQCLRLDSVQMAKL